MSILQHVGVLDLALFILKDLRIFLKYIMVKASMKPSVSF